MSCQVSTIGIPASETSSGAPNDLAYDLEENLFAEFLRGGITWHKSRTRKWPILSHSEHNKVQSTLAPRSCKISHVRSENSRSCPSKSISAFSCFSYNIQYSLLRIDSLRRWRHIPTAMLQNISFVSTHNGQSANQQNDLCGGFAFRDNHVISSLSVISDTERDIMSPQIPRCHMAPNSLHSPAFGAVG